MVPVILSAGARGELMGGEIRPGKDDGVDEGTCSRATPGMMPKLEPVHVSMSRVDAHDNVGWGTR